MDDETLLYELFMSIEQEWATTPGGDHDPFEWNGFRCELLSSDDRAWNAFRIIDGKAIAMLCMYELPPLRWEIEPSPQMLMKLMLVL